MRFLLGVHGRTKDGPEDGIGFGGVLCSQALDVVYIFVPELKVLGFN